MVIRKAFKFRIYPNRVQRDRLAIQFGHARFVYNYYRAMREQVYNETGKGMSYVDTTNDLKRLKDNPEFNWLKDADSQVLQQSLMDLNRAYKNFFEGRARYPRFKSKRDRQSVRYPQRFKVEEGKVYLPKVGWVKLVQHRPIEGKMKNCTVSKTKTGKYFISIQCEIEMSDPRPRSGMVGIDLGLISFVTTSDGMKVPAPKHLRKTERRIKIRQRRLSRKTKGSNNREKARQRVAILHERIANQRRDFHHKLSRSLVERYGYIVFEGLNIKGMLSNHHLAKSIADAGWGQFIRFCKYKADWSDGVVVNTDRFFASTKACSSCGHVNHSLKLSDRQWTCSDCGVVHDRDVNAAVNILNTTTVGATGSHASGDTIPIGGSAQEAHRL